MSERDERERAYAAILEIADNLHKVGPEHADEARSVLHDAARLLSAEPRPDLLEALERMECSCLPHADKHPEGMCDRCRTLREQQPEPVAWLVETRKPGGIWGALPPVGTEEEAQRLASHGPLLGFESRITPLAPCGPAETVE